MSELAESQKYANMPNVVDISNDYPQRKRHSDPLLIKSSTDASN